MRKGWDLILVGLLLLVLWAMGMASPAFASSVQATASRAPLAHATLALPGWRRHPRRGRAYGWQENTQSIRTMVNDVDNKSYRGHDQGNDGNQGYNRGYNQDNNGSIGNQIVNRGSRRSSRNIQDYQVIRTHSDNESYFGYRQGNNGNSGYNSGYNQDNSGALGNQIINP